MIQDVGEFSSRRCVFTAGGFVFPRCTKLCISARRGLQAAFDPTNENLYKQTHRNQKVNWTLSVADIIHKVCHDFISC